jgi:hypothetical protein
VSAIATRERAGILIDPPATERSAQRLFEPPGGEVTFEDLILGRWEDLSATGRAECPVCGGRMHSASCEDCGSELS